MKSRGRTEFNSWSLLLSGPSESTVSRAIPESAKGTGIRWGAIDCFVQTMNDLNLTDYRVTFDCQHVKREASVSQTIGDVDVSGHAVVGTGLPSTFKRVYQAALRSLGT